MGTQHGVQETKHHETSTEHQHYRRLLLMAALSFGAMYGLMYAMVNTLSNILPNLNQLYMAGLMAAPMTIIELMLMKMMYRNNTWNALIIAGSALMLLGCWIGIRQQVGISDRQFLKSMIPHHAGAILMCEQASIQDPENKALCRNIIASQQAEIEQMKAALRRLDR